jgi:hypothetical protein
LNLEIFKQGLLRTVVEKLSKYVINRLHQPAQSAESHPDADLLTAFAEQSLATQERAIVMDHLARCGDCRDVLVMALPVTEVAHYPARVSDSGMSWLSWPALRWAALAAGIVAVTSVGIVQYQHGRAEKIVASIQQPEKPVLQWQSAGQPAVPQSAAPIGPSRDEKLGNVEHRDAKRRNFTASKPMAPTPHAFSGRQAAGVNTEPASTITENQIAKNQPDLPMNRSNVMNMDVVKAKDPVPAASAAPRSSAGTAAPSSLQWEVTATGTLLRSYDLGKTWENVNPGLSLDAANTQDSNAGLASQQRQPGQPAADDQPKAMGLAAPVPTFRSVATVGSEVWAGGSAGLLIHSIDGGNLWIRVVPSAPGAALTGDIVAIQFRDPQHGTVTTSTAESWRTSNSGVSWQKQN